jgi:hypothetical protein
VSATPVYTDTYQQFIWIGFSEPLSTSTAISQSFQVHSGDKLELPGRVLIDGVINALRFLPGKALKPGTVYTVTVSGSVTDSSGNPMGHDTFWWFRTQDKINCLANQLAKS